MININLLPINEFRHRRRGRVFLTILGLGLAFLAAGLYSFKINVMDARLERLTAESTRQEGSLEALRLQVGVAGLRTAAIIKKWRQLEAIIQLEERRRDLTRILVELDQLLPQDNAWLLSLTHNENILTIEGISKDKEIISQFLSKLESARYIEPSSVNLLEIAQNMVINQISLTRFKISARTTFPQPVVLDEGLPGLSLPSRAEMLQAVRAAAPDLAASLEAGAAPGGKKTL